jgi:hypothetical protein
VSGNNLIIPGQGEFGKLPIIPGQVEFGIDIPAGTGMSLTFFTVFFTINTLWFSLRKTYDDFSPPS